MTSSVSDNARFQPPLQLQLLLLIVCLTLGVMCTERKGVSFALLIEMWGKAQVRGHLMSQLEYAECARVLHAKEFSHSMYKAWARRGYIVRVEGDTYTLLLKTTETVGAAVGADAAEAAAAAAAPAMRLETLRKVPRLGDIYDILVSRHAESGHAGALATYKRISEEFHGIPKVMVEAFLTHCQQCILKHAAHAAQRTAVTAIRVREYRERAHLDLVSMERLPGGVDKDYKYILHYVDGFTRFSVLRPLRRKSAEEVTTVVLEIFLTFGSPRLLHTDNGKEFLNEWLIALAARFHVRMVKGKPYKPNVNGRVEKANRTMKDKIKTWISARMSIAELDWVPALIEFQYQLNTQYRRCIKSTPYKLVFNQAHLQTHPVVQDLTQTNSEESEDALCAALENDLLLSDSDANNDSESDLTDGGRVHAARLADAQVSNDAYADGYENNPAALRFQPDDWVTISLKYGNQVVHANSLLPARMLMRVIAVEGTQAKLFCEHGALTHTRSFGELRTAQPPVPPPAWSKTAAEVRELLHQHKKDATLFQFSFSDEQILAKESAKYHAVTINSRKTSTARAKEALKVAKQKEKAEKRQQERALFEEFKQQRISTSQVSAAAAAAAASAADASSELNAAKRRRHK
jgi:transposase InsO family protein